MFIGICCRSQVSVYRTIGPLVLFIACKNRKKSALLRELLSNNSLFVSQLYADKSLALRARDLISQLTARADLFLKYSIFSAM